jgi:DNA-directed RNA polymerase specialized sigma24 family protein
MVDRIKCISDGEKDILERAISDRGARKLIVERYQKLLFGFVLSFASFSREQAFEIAASSFVHTFSQMRRISMDGAFLEELFRRALREFDGIIPAGNADLTAFGDFPPPKKESLKIVREALIRLSSEDKAVLLLRDQCHLSFERIAGILGTQPRQTRSACLASRERLREAVQALLEKKTG